MRFFVLVLSGLWCLAPPAWAVNKCRDANGGTVYQDAPCTGKGEVVDVRPSSGSSPAGPRPEPAASPPPPAFEPPPPAPVPEPPAPPNKTQLELDAEQCLNWYRPRLRDPKGAYYTNPSRDKRVLTIDLHATNGYGGYVVKAASCEILSGRLNEAWTKEHAKRGGWVEP